jgi:hypothetical protein
VTDSFEIILELSPHSFNDGVPLKCTSEIQLACRMAISVDVGSEAPKPAERPIKSALNQSWKYLKRYHDLYAFIP